MQVEACNQELCADHLRCQSCQWGAWSEWGLCSKCGGQRAHLESLSLCRIRLQASYHREDAAAPGPCNGMQSHAIACNSAAPINGHGVMLPPCHCPRAASPCFIRPRRCPWREGRRLAWTWALRCFHRGFQVGSVLEEGRVISTEQLGPEACRVTCEGADLASRRERAQFSYAMHSEYILSLRMS